MHHSESSMKVGVDGVLIGAWGNVKGRRGLDVGTGCGLIALMAAQRNPFAIIEAVDIHPGSVKEANKNFALSPWSENLIAYECDAFSDPFLPSRCNCFDFILSNPPFFCSGINNPISDREKARHQSVLSPEALLRFSYITLKYGGTLSFITTTEEEYENLISKALEYNLFIERLCLIADKPDKKSKRVMLSFRKLQKQVAFDLSRKDKLFIRNTDGSYSERYRQLTSEFYLNF